MIMSLAGLICITAVLITVVTTGTVLFSRRKGGGGIVHPQLKTCPACGNSIQPHTDSCPSCGIRLGG